MTPPPTLDWWRQGEQQLTRTLTALADQDLDEPSLLPGWTRRTVVAHLARNADAVGNLLTWARTGEPTPMYASAQEREEGITRTTQLPAHELLQDCRAAAERFVAAVDALPVEAWNAEVVTAQGRTVPAAEVPWMRSREVWMHSIDLRAGTGFTDLPEDLLVAVVDDVHRTWRRKGHDPGTTIVSDDGRSFGAGPARVTGTLADLAGWVTGRAAPPTLHSDGGLPPLPAWL